MRAALSCTVVLLVGFVSVSSAHAHVQPQAPSQVETIAAAAATETCCHDVDRDAPAFTCAASACGPAAAGVALASSLTWNRKPSVVSLTYDCRAGSLASLPLLHPPISA